MPLHQAAYNGHLETVRLLVDRDARLDVRDTAFQATPLHWSEHAGNIEVANYLRAQGTATGVSHQSRSDG